MRILIIHTHYRQKGGEDTAVDLHYELLKDSESCEKLIFRNDVSILGSFQFLFSIWNLSASQRLRKTLNSFKPDVVHLHNWHFASGPIIIRRIKKMGIPVVVTLHNYRLVCPSGILFNDQKVFCGSIKSSFPWVAIYYRAYRDSFSQTFWLAFINFFHKKIGTWKMVDKYLLLTQFAKDVFLGSTLGISSDKFEIKPNFIFPASAKSSDKKGNLFVGRLVREKGVEHLLETFDSTNETIEICGDGPLASLVNNYAFRRKNILYTGSLEKAEIMKRMASAEILIFPSLWYEGMPMTIIEAFSAGTPVIANNLGAMSTMIIHGYNGLHYDGTSKGLISALTYWSSLSREEKAGYNDHALKTYQENYTPERNYEQLMGIYKNAIDKK